MREIEVKASLENRELFLRKAAEKGIEFGPPIVQEDTTYETELPYDDPNWNIFRIRMQDGKAILTMKYKASNRSRDNHERESIVEDPEQIATMLERVGYKLGVHIRKSRQKATYEGVELCLDEIDELGSFVEVEKLTDEHADVDTIQSDLWKLLSELGVDSEHRIHQGYDTLMHAHIKTKS